MVKEMVFNCESKKNETKTYEEIPKTEEEIKEEREQEILSELKMLDNTVDRQWEDYYIKWEITPVDRIAVVIIQKEELRKELQNLTKVGE